jgi:hypothetical protein
MTMRAIPKLSDADLPLVAAGKTSSMATRRSMPTGCVATRGCARSWTRRPSSRQSRSAAGVNGIVARFQAYTHAVAILADDGEFPDKKGQPQLMPDGFERRKDV